ncbi:MAG: MBL fold metallo-hydrolase [Planctomycetaceae bacterium]|nr:MBL fold metallo-hydrolase [Planctomycetaceae bacterium]
MKRIFIGLFAVAAMSHPMTLPAQTTQQANSPKPATSATVQINQQEYKRLDFSDNLDYQEATRGFIADVEDGILRNEKGEVAADLKQYDFITGESPATVNPALWRHAGLTKIRGLFKVTDGFYQVRGFDLTNISFVKTKTGYLVIDPCTNPTAAKAAYDLLKKHVGDYPVVAVISSHSHTDHYGGIPGVVSHEEVISGKIPYITPAGFYEESVSETVLLGNAMSRRGLFQMGVGLPVNEFGVVDNGLGKSYRGGVFDPSVLWRPNTLIDHTGQTLEIDGEKLIFQYTPETEAPAELMFYIPSKKVFFCAELGTRTLHNLLPPRGVKIRDAKAWAYYLDEAITLFGKDLEYVVPAHSWPFFGKERSLNFLEKQSDLYKYIHDQTIHLANLGLNQEEIAATIKLPASLDSEWFNQDFYGAVQHNVKAVYQYYLGWFDGNPANYNRLPQKEEAVRYVEWFGGEKAALEKAKESYRKGDYQWVVQALKWVVFANSGNTEAKNLQADAYEQLGYQSRSSIWRNMYLTAAHELRNGNVTRNFPNRPGRLRNLLTEDLFNYLSVAIDGTKADGKECSIRFDITDEEKSFHVFLKNGVLHHKPSTGTEQVQLTLHLPKDKLQEFVMTAPDTSSVLNADSVKTDGDVSALALLASLITHFHLNWNIVTD